MGNSDYTLPTKKEFIGKKDGISYYIEPDEDDSGLSDPIQDDNLWTLISFDQDIPMDVNPANMNDIDIYMGNLGKLGIETDFKDLKAHDEMNGKSEAQILKDFRKTFANVGYVMLPISILEHGTIHLNIGMRTDAVTDQSYADFDSGIGAIAIVSKKDLQKAYYKKRISKKTLRIAISVLKDELKAYEDSYNGDIYFITSYDKNGKSIDSLGFIYGYQVDTRKKALQFATENL